MLSLQQLWVTGAGTGATVMALGEGALVGAEAIVSGGSSSWHHSCHGGQASVLWDVMRKMIPTAIAAITETPGSLLFGIRQHGLLMVLPKFPKLVH